MVKIAVGQELKLDNVLSLRAKIKQEDIQLTLKQIGQYLERVNIQKQGPIVTATFGVEQISTGNIVDIEILIPTDKRFQPEGPYTFKEKFHLVNAVYARHTGNPASLENTYRDAMSFITSNDLQPITAGYSVNVNELSPSQSPEDLIIDIFIGINPSIL
ncbi:hypothetical protein R70723_30040 [Paenibacillus sp. FSL R7-0273]|uniref:GyrI-like domain-containing protein n=1 Tax=Paenibacillus sp. FSL R7-0273 TaxID=1536772 RepID=UPI0004F69315|nr:GyrI-like domain-containing protein [Paenibacillus sp. FSL R7-0273]AIQ49647.1 hypothetical protein R70723_30040 [Paenibacillus sp. FSL R7-0273]OMF90290.1 hypothetical protein BK144_18020 [Paenibacillus sp. FSL R7-0273]